MQLQYFQRRDWNDLTRGVSQENAVSAHELAAHCMVPLPPLPSNVAALNKPINDAPKGFSNHTAYQSAAITQYTVRQALVHSAAGIIGVAPYLVAETLNHTAGDRHCYDLAADGSIALKPTRIRTVAGTAFTIMSGGYETYYHWMMDGVARLAALRGAMETQPGSLLVPPLGNGFRRQSLQHLSWLSPDRVVEVDPGEALLVERLIAPATVTGAGWSVHPAISDIFDGMSERVAGQGSTISQFYISRLHAANRPMRNEQALIERLSRIGISAVTLEAMPLSAQMRLFSQATLIIGAHGAGLTNLVFSPPDCRVVEIFDARYVNWCFRVIAASRGLYYDAAISHQENGMAPPSDQSWSADIPAVLSALALARQQA